MPGGCSAIPKLLLFYFFKTYMTNLIICISLLLLCLKIAGELVGLPYLPAFTSTLTSEIKVINGVNYASAAAGILDETGRQLVMSSIYNLDISYNVFLAHFLPNNMHVCMKQGDRFSLRQQVQNFETTLNQLKSQMDEKELSQYLGRALAVMILGSNDYINNYLLPTFYTTSSNYNPVDYADLLIGRYTSHILVWKNMIYSVIKFPTSSLTPCSNSVKFGQKISGILVIQKAIYVWTFFFLLSHTFHEADEAFDFVSFFFSGTTKLWS